LQYRGGLSRYSFLRLTKQFYSQIHRSLRQFWLAEYVVGGSRSDESEGRVIVVGGRVREDANSPLLVGHVQKASVSVHSDRRRTSAQPGTARQHRAAATPPRRVEPVDLLVVQVGDEHVTGSAVDRDGAREERTLIAAVGRWTPPPACRLTISGQTRHLTANQHPHWTSRTILSDHDTVNSRWHGSLVVRVSDL